MTGEAIRGFSRGRAFAAALWPLALVVLVGATLRFYRLGANSLWIDEFATLDLANHSPAEILRLSSSANFIPPLYFILVHGATRLLGESEVSLRLLSAIAGIGTIPVVWLLTAVIAGDRTTAHLAAGLLAVNPLHLWYSQEARPYALLVLFGCCALVAFARAIESGSLRAWVGFWACATLAILTHTTGIICVAVAWTWGLVSPNRRSLLRPLLVSSLAIGLTCAPFFIAIARALEETGGTFHSPPRPITGLEVGYTLLTYVTGYSFGPVPRDIQNLGAWAALRNNAAQSILAATILLGLLGISVRKWRDRPTQWFTALLAVSLGFIFVLAALSGKAYNVRYTLPGLVGFMGLVSVALRALAPRSRALGLAALIGMMLWADGQWFWVRGYWKEDSRAAVAWLGERLGPGAVVAVAPSYYDQPLAYYSNKAGAALQFVDIPPGTDSLALRPLNALVLTRLHHVPDWKKLKASFVRRAGPGVLETEVAGYQVLISQSHR